MSDTKKLRKIPPEAFQKQLLTIFPVHLNSFIGGISSGWISNAVYFFHKGDPQSFSAIQSSMIASSSGIGCTLFALPVGYITDKIGRKAMMIIAGIAHAIGWTILSISSSYTSICTARIILGIALSLVHSIGSITIGELSSPEIRAKLTSIGLFSFYLGQLFPSLLNILFSSYHIISYSSLTITTLYFLSLHFFIETPYYLTSKSKYKEAKENLKKVRIGYPENIIDEEFETFKIYIDEEKKRKEELNWWKFFSSRRIMKPLLLILIIHFFDEGLGGYTIMTYITKIVPKNIEFLPIQYYPFIIQCLRISSSLLTPFFIELFPRRVAILSFIMLTFVSLVSIGTSYFCFVGLSVNFCKWILVVCLLLVTGVESNFIFSAVSTIRGELLPQTIKGIGSSMCMMVFSSTDVLYFQVYRIISENYDLHWIFFIFSINAVILFFIIYFCLPETRGEFLANIQLKRDEEVGDKEDEILSLSTRFID